MGEFIPGKEVALGPSSKPETNKQARPSTPGYSYYALGVLAAANMFVVADRQVFAVLAESIKQDVGLTDADIGFLYGTGISIFYAIFSIPLGRCADLMNRRRVLGFCLAACSAMICFTGLSRNFPMMAAARIGVGIGESGCSPASLSLLADYFPAHQRSTAMSIWGGAVQIGGGLAVVLSGLLLSAWAGWFLSPDDAPFGLHGWQVVFLAFSICGPALALWVITLSSPRGPVTMKPAARTAILDDAISLLPLVSLPRLVRLEPRGRAASLNIMAGLFLTLLAWTLIHLTGDIAQWLCFSGGLWCLISWIQSSALRDRRVFDEVVAKPALLLSNLGFASFVFVSIGLLSWCVPFMVRTHGMSPAHAGTMFGLITALLGSTGTICGGILADRLQRTRNDARQLVAIAGLSLAVPAAIAFISAPNMTILVGSLSVFVFSSSVWYGLGPAIATDLVPPAKRGLSSAFYLILISLLGVGLGPYSIGALSDQLSAAGNPPADALRTAMLVCIAFAALPVTLLYKAGRLACRDHDQALSNFNQQEML